MLQQFSLIKSAVRAISVSLAAALLITACSNIPVSTMVRMSQFNEQDVIALNPELLRLKITMTRGLLVNMDKTKLQLDVHYDQGEQVFAFDLTELSRMDSQALHAWFGEPEKYTEQVLRLSDSGLAQMRTLQSTLVRQKPDDFRYDVRVTLNHMDPEVIEGEFSVAIQFSPEQDYIVLLQQVPVRAGEHREY